MWEHRGDKIRCTQCGKTSSPPIPPCRCRPGDVPAEVVDDDSHESALNDLAALRFAILEGIKASDVGGRDYVLGCTNMLRTIMARHKISREREEDREVSRLRDAVEKLKSLSDGGRGRALRQTVGETQDDSGSESDCDA